MLLLTISFFQIEFVTGTKKGTTTSAPTGTTSTTTTATAGECPLDACATIHKAEMKVFIVISLFCNVLYRCTKKEEQMGLCYTNDHHFPAHHSHYHRHIALCCHSNHQRKWLKNDRHLCCRYHCQEGQAVKPDSANRLVFS